MKTKLFGAILIVSVIMATGPTVTAVDCPTWPGAHYHLSDYTQNNTVEDNKWTEDMILLDDASDYNPNNPATYNGDNIIELGHSH